MSKVNSTQITLGLGLLAVGAVYLVGRSAMNGAGGAAGKLGTWAEVKLAPWSMDNVFYGGANKLTQAVTGDANTTLGSTIADIKDYIFGNPADDLTKPTPLPQKPVKKSIMDPVMETADGLYDAMGNFIGYGFGAWDEPSASPMPTQASVRKIDNALGW